MAAILLDTHVWTWSLTDDRRLSRAALAALEAADAVHVSAISFFEIGQKVRIGKWPEMAALAETLPALLAEQGGLVSALSAEICLDAALMDWAHRDPFDRLIASTARLGAMRLLSSDAVFDQVPEIARVW
jgi:PIN domain nuclease of toxin-antitoxin system